MLLRDYQIKCIDAVRQAYRDGKRAPLLVAPCGAGKTLMFSYMCKGATERGKRTLILVHRQELVDQVSAALKKMDVNHGIISPGYQPLPHLPVQVASVFTLVRRLDRIATPDFIIVDEAHHAILQSTWGKVIAAFPTARLCGNTATPTRLSGEGLGDIFDQLVVGPSTQELIDKGWLSPVRVFSPPTIDVSGVHSAMGDFKKGELAFAVDKPKITGDAIEHYQRLTPGKKAAVFCVSIQHASNIADAARRAAITAVMIEGKTDRHLRREIVNDFSKGIIRWLVSVDIIAEGWDCPSIEVGIFLRPTHSLGLWVQQTGRILRTSPGKTDAILLDHAGNTLRHGLPTEERYWSLSGTAKARDGGSGAISVRVCPSCFSAQRSGRITCGNCGKPFPVEPRVIAKAKGTLREITEEDLAARRARQEVGRTATLEQLTELGRIRGYRNADAWAKYVLAGREKKRQAR